MQLGTYPFSTGESGDHVAAFESYLGAPQDYWLKFFHADTWAAMRSSADQLTVASKPSLRAVVKLGLNTPETTLAQVAAGTQDADFTYIMNKVLAAMPTGEIMVALGWEMNLAGFSSWYAIGNEANYNAAFRHIVPLLRGLSSRIKISWNPNNTTGNPMAYYPGDEYVDDIGTDLYFNRGFVSNDDVNGYYNHQMDESKTAYGYRYYANLAVAKGKSFSVHEFAINSDDFTPYMGAFLDKLVADNVKYLGLWDSNDAFNGSTYNETYPNWSALFKARLGQPAITSPTTRTAAANTATTFALTANHAATFAIVGGANAAAFVITNGSLTMTAQTAGTRIVTIRATDKRGLFAEQAVTVTVAA